MSTSLTNFSEGLPLVMYLSPTDAGRIRYEETHATGRRMALTSSDVEGASATLTALSGDGSHLGGPVDFSLSKSGKVDSNDTHLYTQLRWGNEKIAKASAFVTMNKSDWPSYQHSMPTSDQSTNVLLEGLINQSSVKASKKAAAASEIKSLCHILQKNTDGVVLSHNDRQADDGGEFATGWSIGPVKIRIGDEEAEGWMYGKLSVSDAEVQTWLREAGTDVDNDVTSIIAYKSDRRNIASGITARSGPASSAPQAVTISRQDSDLEEGLGFKPGDLFRQMSL